MADIISDGMTRVSWVSSISNTAAPTTTELNAGTALESFVTADGWEASTETADVDNSALNSTQNSTLAGRRTDSLTLTFKQQGKANAPWTTFASNPTGYIVRRSGVAASTAWTASQKVTVYPVQAGFRNEMAPAPNTLEKFSVAFKVTSAPVDTASVA
jgi:hypothetical protein